MRFFLLYFLAFLIKSTYSDVKVNRRPSKYVNLLANKDPLSYILSFSSSVPLNFKLYCPYDHLINITSANVSIPNPDPKNKNPTPALPKPLDITRTLKNLCQKRFSCFFTTLNESVKTQADYIPLYLPDLFPENENRPRKLTITGNCIPKDSYLIEEQFKTESIILRAKRNTPINIACPMDSHIRIDRSSYFFVNDYNPNLNEHGGIKAVKNHPIDGQKYIYHQVIMDICDGKNSCKIENMFDYSLVTDVTYQCMPMSFACYNYIHVDSAGAKLDGVLSTEFAETAISCGMDTIQITSGSWQAIDGLNEYNKPDIRRTNVIDILTDFCNGKKTCIFRPVGDSSAVKSHVKELNLGGRITSDHFHKLYITYKCLRDQTASNVKQTTINVDKTFKMNPHVFSCDQDQSIDIYSATWKSTASRSSRRNNSYTCFDSREANVTEKLVDHCQGKNSCSVSFDDPRYYEHGLKLLPICPNEPHQLIIRYVCRPKTFLPTKFDFSTFNEIYNAYHAANKNYVRYPSSKSTARLTYIEEYSIFYMTFSFKMSLLFEIGHFIKIYLDKQHNKYVVESHDKDEKLKVDQRHKTEKQLSSNIDRMIITLTVLPKSVLAFNFELFNTEDQSIETFTHTHADYGDTVQDLLRVYSKDGYPNDLRAFLYCPPRYPKDHNKPAAPARPAPTAPKIVVSTPRKAA